jgi:hypothetical protein
MGEHKCNFCTIIEDNVAWLIGFIDGLMAGLFYSCNEYVDDDTNVLNELIQGAKTGFKDGTWVGTLHK